MLVRCRNCGRYFESEDEEKKFCSDTCAEGYRQCKTCGRYYNKAVSENPDYCSESCSAKMDTAKYKTHHLKEEEL